VIDIAGVTCSIYVLSFIRPHRDKISYNFWVFFLRILSATYIKINLSFSSVNYFLICDEENNSKNMEISFATLHCTI